MKNSICIIFSLDLFEEKMKIMVLILFSIEQVLFQRLNIICSISLSSESRSISFNIKFLSNVNSSFYQILKYLYYSFKYFFI